MLPLKWELSNKVCNIALGLSRKKLKEHPEKGATLLFMGRHQKSIWRLERARSLFELCLEEHFMTAQSHKAMELTCTPLRKTNPLSTTKRL